MLPNLFKNKNIPLSSSFLSLNSSLCKTSKGVVFTCWVMTPTPRKCGGSYYNDNLGQNDRATGMTDDDADDGGSSGDCHALRALFFERSISSPSVASCLPRCLIHTTNRIVCWDGAHYMQKKSVNLFFDIFSYHYLRRGFQRVSTEE